jgi:hypothetical protein
LKEAQKREAPPYPYLYPISRGMASQPGSCAGAHARPQYLKAGFEQTIVAFAAIEEQPESKRLICLLGPRQTSGRRLRRCTPLQAMAEAELCGVLFW